MFTHKQSLDSYVIEDGKLYDVEQEKEMIPLPSDVLWIAKLSFFSVAFCSDKKLYALSDYTTLTDVPGDIDDLLILNIPGDYVCRKGNSAWISSYEGDKLTSTPIPFEVSEIFDIDGKSFGVLDMAGKKVIYTRDEKGGFL